MRSHARRLRQVLNDRELIDQASAETTRTSPNTTKQNKLAAIQRKLAEIHAAMDRYFRAFETATMPEDTAAPRIAASPRD
jgi:hypothetical protein